MGKEIKIAICTPGRFKPMGTFSRNYIEFFPFEKIVLFGGPVPYFYYGTSKTKQKWIRYLLTLLSLGSEKKLQSIIKNRFKRILKKEKIDCVFTEFLNTGAAVRLACEELNIPIVSNVLGYEIHKTDVLDRLFDEYQKLARYKSVVVPVAKNMIPKLEKIGFTEEQIYYSPLGAREEFFEIKPNYKCKQILAVGRFTESKSPQSTIRAFHHVLKNHEDATLIMAGEGEMLDECRQLVQQLGIQEKVRFPGWITPNDQIEFLKNSCMFVQHSITATNGDAEGTPVAIIEASAAGLPIVSTIHGGIPDVVINGETGFLVKEKEWEEMGARMCGLLDNLSMLEAFGKNGKQFINKNFSMKAHINVATKCIESAVNL